jgi:hypothetical protein
MSTPLPIPILDWNESFETTSALAALFLWVMFGSIYTLLNCDLQRALNDNILIKHLTGLMAFFLLFNIIDPNNKSHVVTTIAKTIVVYLLFLMATKSKWPFIALALCALFTDQVLRNHIAYLKNKYSNEAEAAAVAEPFVKARTYIKWAIFAIIVVGFLHYLMRQYQDKGHKFDIFKLVLGTGKCSNARVSR